MAPWQKNCDPGATIPAGSASDGGVEDFQQLRGEFHIYPGEDGAKYQDLKLLGMGGMGVVFSGEDPTLERQVAIKILREPYRHDREQIAKFVNEARITARIDHPNVVSVHQLGLNEHHGIYFSMRRISGETLQNIIRRLREGDPEAVGCYTTRQLVDFFIAGCNGVAAAHGKRILHCDLKPANIMVGAFGEVLVLDWGLAREFGTPIADKKNIAGTPAHMAPELVCGEVDGPDELTDVYALGTILYSILTLRQAPFDMSLEKDALLEKVASGKYLPLRAPKKWHWHRELAAICRKAMARDRQERYATVSELLNDLQNFRDGRPVKAYSPNIFYRFFKLCRRHPAIPIAVIVAGMTLAFYSMALRLINYTHDRSLMNSFQINLQVADSFFSRSMTQFRMIPVSSDLSDPVRLAIRERNVLLQSQLALTEYFSILDSAAGLSAAGQNVFIREHAAYIFKRILYLQIQAGDPDKLHDVLARCRRWSFFATACESDPVLANLVSRIESDTGTISFNFTGDASRHGRLIMADGRVAEMEFISGKQLDLQAGDYQLQMDDGVKAYLRIMPGSLESLILPQISPESQCVAVPADFFSLDLPDSGAIRCNVDAFLIKPYNVPAFYSMEEARAILAQFNTDGQNSWHLPNASELLKVWRNFDGSRNFYGLPLAEHPVLLENGDFYNPVSGKVEKSVPGNRGLIYLVKDI